MAETLKAMQLEGVELFGNLKEEEREIIAPFFKLEKIRAGDFMFSQGEERTAVHLILEGEITLSDETEGVRKLYSSCTAGCVLGEPLLTEEKGRYSLGGQAVCETRAASLNEEAIIDIRSNHPHIFSEIVLELSRLLAGRLSNANPSERGNNIAYRSGVVRSEHDLLGDRDIPENALWGVQTLRGLENFSITGVRLSQFPEMIEALALVKRACAEVNFKLNRLDPEIHALIVRACDEIRRGQWHGHFVVDMIQGGAGTSTNMNINEVIANRALDLAGDRRGNYSKIHPNNHVNMSQSTNDVYPSAIKLTLMMMSSALLEELELLVKSFHGKGDEFSGVIKMGRTQLQDAVPMTLGQEFNAWGRIIQAGTESVRSSLANLRFLNLGGTAIGTGINAPPEFPELVVEELNQLTDLNVERAIDLVEGTQDTGAFVELSGVLQMLAVRLSKICNDLRLLSSGPRCGLNEINLPPMAPGSSIMPGKVNPVIPEVVNQVAFQVIGLNNATAMASEGGQLELNVFEPLIAYNLFTGLKMLRNAANTLRLRCIDGITANEEHTRKMVQNSIGIVTALNPVIGYEAASRIAREALENNRSVYDIVLEEKLMGKAELDDLLSIENMV